MLFPSHILILAIVLGSLGMWLMLPRGAAHGRGVGMAIAAIAFGLGASLGSSLGDWTTSGVFWGLAVLTVGAAAAAVTFRNPVYCAIWFGQSVLGSASLLLFLGAQFLAVATVVVYAGAILVTFLFVLMLAQPEGRAAYDRVSWESLLSASTGAAIAGLLATLIGRALTQPLATPTETALREGILTPNHVAAFGAEMFGRHLVAVDIGGLLLLVALVGAAAIVGDLHTDGHASAATPNAETNDR